MSSSSSPPPPASSSTAAGVTSFLSAFSALHHHPDVAVKAEANRWLMSFQASPEAWQVSDAVLHAPQLSDEVYYNAANILRHKLMHNYYDLPGKACTPRSHSTVYKLTTLKSQRLPTDKRQPASQPAIHSGATQLNLTLPLSAVCLCGVRVRCCLPSLVSGVCARSRRHFP